MELLDIEDPMGTVPRQESVSNSYMRTVDLPDFQRARRAGKIKI
jgi:hypothetical protein